MINGSGFSKGQGSRQPRRGRAGQGRMVGNRPGSGPGGYCICPKPDCDGRVVHQRGVPCFELDCPNCGAKMVKE